MKLSKRLAAFWALNLSPLPSVLAASTCSQLSGSIYTGYNGNGFDILCDTSTVNGNIFAYYSEGEQFQDCVDRCDVVPSCIVALSFSGNDIAIKRAVESSTSASSEATSMEATTSEAATSSEAATTEATSTEATSTEGTTSEPATTSEAASTEATSTEATTSEATTSEISTTSETLSVSLSSMSSEDTASGSSSTSEPLSESTASSTTSVPSSSLESISETSTSAESTAATTATTNSFSTGTASIETSTDDCDDETIRDTIHDPIHRQPHFLHYNQSTIRGFHFCSPSYFNYFITIFFDDDTKPDFYINISPKLCYKPSSQVASSSGSSSSDTTEVGSKTLSTSGATIIKTTSESHLPTSYPTTDSVWTVYLTLVKYVTCTTGVVAETVTTATYVTVDSNGGSYGPPVVTMPDGCNGGYQVDASGHSYPIAQPTKGSHVNSPDGENSQPSVRPTLGSPGNSPSGYETGQLHIPTPAAESQGNSQPEQGNKQPSVAGQGSSKPNNSEPQPTQGDATQTAISAYQSGTLVNPLLSSSIRQGQQGISTTFATEASVTEEMQAPKSTHNHLSEAEEAPSAPVTISGANRHQCMVWTLVAGAFLGLGMLF
ncbi:hypothetical protein FOXYS1_7162 [Fusarium oxysporum]|uniref:Proteoglycan n=1 Tax=Fusarium oxysporum TaxID=5507 RepID=A0A8H5AB61_FUSOX|nr:hypothetical protein FOXYS1_7162 [Fusarium oxysporum]